MRGLRNRLSHGLSPFRTLRHPSFGWPTWPNVSRYTHDQPCRTRLSVYRFPGKLGIREDIRCQGGRVQPRRINILEGSTFVVSDLRGDISTRQDEAAGLFYRDMRHLSRWQLRLNGRELDVLSADAVEFDEAF